MTIAAAVTATISTAKHVMCMKYAALEANGKG